MIPHPDFAALDVPQSLTLGRFGLDILTAADLDEDYAAVMGSAAVLRGLFGTVWPDGLTLADDETDLHWHHREFTARRSYAWVIRLEGSYIGCAYLAPDIGTRGAGQATTWIVDRPDRAGLLADFVPLYRTWLEGLLPAGYALRSIDNAGIG